MAEGRSLAWDSAVLGHDECDEFRYGRAMSERITVDPEICHGKPTIRGLRYPVSLVLELLAGGMSTEEILADYKDLEREDILACVEAGR